MSNIWFTSDTHFYHANVIHYCSRPYVSVEEMNEAMINNWNNLVKPEDTIYHLGDFSLAFRPVETITPRLNGIKYLIPGNHDFCHPANRKGKTPDKQQMWVDKYRMHGWDVFPLFGELDIPGVTRVNLCHLPYHQGDTTDDRFSQYRLRDDGRWLLCGHVHEKWKRKGRMINVGVDAWEMKPVHIEQIKEIINVNPE